jgi:hypothetical protein
MKKFYRVDFVRNKEVFPFRGEIKTDKGYIFLSASSEDEKEFLIKDFLCLGRRVKADLTVMEIHESEVNQNHFGWGKEFSEELV